MKNNSVIKTVNWIVPIFVLGLIIFNSTVEALVLAVAYFIYRIIIDLSKIYSYIAIKYYQKGALTKARKYYKKAYEAKVKEQPIAASYAYLLILLEEYDKASEVLDYLETQQIQGRVVVSVLLCRAVLVWKVQKNLTGALSMVESVDESMRNQWYYNVYAKLCIFSGNMERAKNAAIKGYEYLNSNPVALENLLIVHCINEEYEKALSAADKLLSAKASAGPASKDAYYFCGLAYEKDGNVEKAGQLYKKALLYEHTSMTYVQNDAVLEKGSLYSKWGK